MFPVTFDAGFTIGGLAFWVMFGVGLATGALAFGVMFGETLAACSVPLFACGSGACVVQPTSRTDANRKAKIIDFRIASIWIRRFLIRNGRAVGGLVLVYGYVLKHIAA